MHWLFTTALSTALVYVNARMFTRTNTVLHGLFAVWLFLSTQALFVYAGSPLADCTLLLLTMIGITLYQVYHRLHRHRWPLLIGLGCILFLSTETKELGICLAVLVLGLGFDNDDRFSSRLFAKRIGLTSIGLLIGFLGEAALHAAFIDTPWQWFDSVKKTVEFVAALPRHGVLAVILLPFVSPDTVLAGVYAQLPDFFTLPSRTVIEYYTWYEALTRQGGVLVLLVLYCLAGVTGTQAQRTRSDRILWLFPLVTFVTLTIAGVRVTFSGERHFLSALAVMSVLAAQWKPVHRVRSLVHVSGVVALAGGCALLVRAGVLELADRYFLHAIDVYRGYIYPISIGGLLALFFWVKTWSLRSLFVGFVCVFLVTGYTFLQIPAVLHDITSVGQNRLAMYRTFQDEIDTTDSMSMFMSLNITLFKYEGIWWDNYVRLYEAFFDDDGDMSQFTITTALDSVGSQSYIFLSMEDWYALAPEQRQHIEATYLVKPDPTHTFIFAAQVDYVLAAAETILADDPDASTTRTNRAEAYAKHGNLDAALTDFDEALRLAPDYVRALVGRGRVFVHQGNQDAALADFDRALALQPENADALVERGSLYAQQNDVRARADFDALLQPDQPYDNTDGMRFLADYDRIITLVPDYAPGYLVRGLSYERLGNTDQALMDYTHAISLTNDWYAPYASRGSLYHAQQAWEQAISDLSTAIDLQPTQPVFFGCADRLVHYDNEFAAAVMKEHHVPSGLLAECLYFERGTAYANLGQNDLAAADFGVVRQIATDATLFAQSRK